jgi:hypothetical protein
MGNGRRVTGPLPPAFAVLTDANGGVAPFSERLQAVLVDLDRRQQLIRLNELCADGEEARVPLGRRTHAHGCLLLALGAPADTHSTTAAHCALFVAVLDVMMSSTGPLPCP